jgi:hypothetical protein
MNCPQCQQTMALESSTDSILTYVCPLGHQVTQPAEELDVPDTVLPLALLGDDGHVIAIESLGIE